MKKQLFILILAVFAINLAWGQAVHNSDPRPLDPSGCLDDALHPLAGKPYEYGVQTNPSGGSYQWIATKSTDFITNGALTSNVLSVTANELLTFSNTTSQSATISWSSQVLNGVTQTPTTLFVGVQYDVTTPCTTNNFKVYPIVPFKAFTIDLLSMDPLATVSAAYGGTTSQCYDEVQSAKYVGGEIVYNYGVNVLWYELVAANFSENYLPTFQLSGLQGTQTATVEWGYTPGFTTASETITTGTGSGTITYAATQSVTTTVASNYDGVSIYVKVTVYNNSWEGDTGVQPIILAANAINKDGDWDIVNTTDNQYNTCAPPGSSTSFDDTATQDIYQRPVLTPMPVSPGFIPDQP